jgi:hypothetical protein
LEDPVFVEFDWLVSGGSDCGKIGHSATSAPSKQPA